MNMHEGFLLSNEQHLQLERGAKSLRFVSELLDATPGKTLGVNPDDLAAMLALIGDAQREVLGEAKYNEWLAAQEVQGE